MNYKQKQKILSHGATRLKLIFGENLHLIRTQGKNLEIFAQPFYRLFKELKLFFIIQYNILNTQVQDFKITAS